MTAIRPFSIETYEEVLGLGQKSEGVGLSGADSPAMRISVGRTAGKNRADERSVA